MALTDRKILTFDVVGTLVDFEAGVINFFRPIFDKAGVEIEDARILTEFADAEDEQHHLTPGIPFTGCCPRSIAPSPPNTACRSTTTTWTVCAGR